jgi:ribonuclease HI
VDELQWFQDARGLRSRHRPHPPKGDKLHYVLQIHFAASNNVTKYEALIHGLKLAKVIGI